MQSQNNTAENKNVEDGYWSPLKQSAFAIITIGGVIIALFGNLFI